VVAPTTLTFTPTSGINNASVGAPADGIPLEADILSSGATAYQLVQDVDGVSRNIIVNNSANTTTIQTMIVDANTTDDESMFGSTWIDVENGMQASFPTVVNGMVITADASGDGTFTTSANQTETFEVSFFSPDNGQWSKIDYTITAAAAGPVLSLPTETSITTSTVTVGATSDDATGTLYYYISTSATAPSAADLKAGTSSVTFGNTASVSVGTNTFGITGLSGDTTYYTYFLQNDGVIDSSILESGSWSTLLAVPGAFTFTDVTDAALSSGFIDTQVISGGTLVDASTVLSVTNGLTSVTGPAGTFDSSAKTYSAGNSYVRATVTSSGSYSTAVTQTPSVNGISDVFSVTTLAAPPNESPVILGSTSSNAVEGSPFASPYTISDREGALPTLTGTNGGLFSIPSTGGDGFALTLDTDPVNGDIGNVYNVTINIDDTVNALVTQNVTVTIVAISVGGGSPVLSLGVTLGF